MEEAGAKGENQIKEKQVVVRMHRASMVKVQNWDFTLDTLRNQVGQA